LEVRPEHIGQSLQCPGCGRTHVIPALDLSEPPPPADGPPPAAPDEADWPLATDQIVPPRLPALERGGWLARLSTAVWMLLFLTLVLGLPAWMFLQMGQFQSEEPSPEPALSTGELLCLRGHTGYVRSVAVRGNWILSGGGGSELARDEDCTVRLWDLDSGRQLHCFHGHTRPVERVAFSPVGRLALSCGDRTIRLWDLDRLEEVRSLEGHREFLEWAEFSSDGEQVLSCDGLDIRLWEVESGRELCRYDIPAIYSVGFSADNRRALIAGGPLAAPGQPERYPVRLLDLASGAEVWRRDGHTHPVWSVAFFPDGQRGLSAGLDGLVQFWDLAEGQKLGQMRPGLFWRVALSADGRRLLVGGEDHLVRYWDIATHQELCRFRGHSDNVAGVALSADGRRALSASHDRTIRVWELPP
jgi:WD40 repeat protein